MGMIPKFPCSVENFGKRAGCLEITPLPSALTHHRLVERELLIG